MTSTQTQKSKVAIIAVACVIATASIGGPVAACSLREFGDNGRYVGGDLTAQVAAKADTIEVVRVKTRHLVNRTFTAATWYLEYGDTAVPPGQPEYTDVYVFELETIETLKRGGDVPDFLYDHHLRIQGFGPEAFVGSGDRTPQAALHLNALPDWLLDRPGNDGYAFMGASEEAGLGSGECNRPYVLEVGQNLLALRNSSGGLYPVSGAFPLKIDAEFLDARRQRERLSLNMQSLIPINGPDDAFLARLRQALAARPNATRN